jgi:hypothetical protein
MQLETPTQVMSEGTPRQQERRNAVHPWIRVQEIIGSRRIWPRYIILKTFCSYLGHSDLEVLAVFYIGNDVCLDLMVQLLYRVNSHMRGWKEGYVRNFGNWLMGDERIRSRYTYYNVRRRRVVDLDGGERGGNLPLGVGIRGVVGGIQRVTSYVGLDVQCVQALLRLGGHH